MKYYTLHSLELLRDDLSGKIPLPPPPPPPPNAKRLRDPTKAHERRGIDLQHFGELLMTSGLVLMPNVTWLSFHSGYDFGYLLKLLTCDNLPQQVGKGNCTRRRGGKGGISPFVPPLPAPTWGFPSHSVWVTFEKAFPCLGSVAEVSRGGAYSYQFLA